MSWWSDNPEQRLVSLAKARAKRRGLPFALTASDIVIPELCPVLDIPLAHGAASPRAGWPSLDRLIPEQGYVPGNVEVISRRANVIKSDGTAEEHEAIARWMRGHGLQ